MIPMKVSHHLHCTSFAIQSAWSWYFFMASLRLPPWQADELIHRRFPPLPMHRSLHSNIHHCCVYALFCFDLSVTTVYTRPFR